MKADIKKWMNRDGMTTHPSDTMCAIANEYAEQYAKEVAIAFGTWMDEKETAFKKSNKEYPMWFYSIEKCFEQFIKKTNERR